MDAAVAAENQPLPEQLPNYLHCIHTAGTHGTHIWNLQFGLSQIQNRSGQTLTEEIEQQVRLTYIRAGHPATLDLWYPPRYITPPEYIWDIEHEEFLYRQIPVLQAAEPLEHLVVQIDYPR